MKLDQIIYLKVQPFLRNVLIMYFKSSVVMLSVLKWLPVKTSADAFFSKRQIFCDEISIELELEMSFV